MGNVNQRQKIKTTKKMQCCQQQRIKWNFQTIMFQKHVKLFRTIFLLFFRIVTRWPSCISFYTLQGKTSMFSSLFAYNFWHGIDELFNVH